MKYDALDKALKKANCRLEKTMKDEKDEKSITVFASTTARGKSGEELKIIRMSTDDPKKTFDDLADAVHGVILKAGIRLTLMAIADKVDDPNKSKLVDINGNPLSK